MNIKDKSTLIADVSIVSEKRPIELTQSRDDMDKVAYIVVNGKKIKMLEGPATGLEIKEAAIKQNLKIQLNFVLHQELSNGTAKTIGDHDKISIRDHLSFTAIAPDDNS